MGRVRLGDLLVEAQMITSDQLDGVLATQKHDGRRLGTLLVESELVTETQVTQILSQQLAVPWVSLYHIDFSRQLLNLVPREFTTKYCLVPIFVRRVRGLGETLYVAMDDPTDDRAITAIGEYSGLPVRAMIAPPSDIQAAIRVYYGAEEPEPEPEDTDVPDKIRSAREKLGDTHPESPGASSRPEQGSLRSAAPAKPSKTPVEPPEDPAESRPDETPTDEARSEDSADQPQADEGVSAAEVEPPQRDQEASTLDIIVDVDELAAANAQVSLQAESESAESDEAGDDPVENEAPAGPEPMEAAALARPPAADPATAPAATAPPESEPIPDSTEAPAPTSDRIAARRVDMPQPAAARPGKMVSLTLLDGTTISLPAKGGMAPKMPGAAPTAPGEERLTARDLVAALRAASHGADASEILGENAQWESMFAALLSLLLKKHLIADWEFVEEYKKI